MPMVVNVGDREPYSGCESDLLCGLLRRTAMRCQARQTCLSWVSSPQ